MADYPKWITLGPGIGQVLVLDADDELAAKEAHVENVKQGKEAANPPKPVKKY